MQGNIYELLVLLHPCQGRVELVGKPGIIIRMTMIVESMSSEDVTAENVDGRTLSAYTRYVCGICSLTSARSFQKTASASAQLSVFLLLKAPPLSLFLSHQTTLRKSLQVLCSTCTFFLCIFTTSLFLLSRHNVVVMGRQHFQRPTIL